MIRLKFVIEGNSLNIYTFFCGSSITKVIFFDHTRGRILRTPHVIFAKIFDTFENYESTVEALLIVILASEV